MDYFRDGREAYFFGFDGGAVAGGGRGALLAAFADVLRHCVPRGVYVQLEEEREGEKWEVIVIEGGSAWPVKRVEDARLLPNDTGTILSLRHILSFRF